MKKIIFALLATATSISFANADTPFNGFYLGAEGGFTQRTVTDSVVENSSGGGQSTQSGFISSSYKNKINGFVYGLMGGYGRNINDFILGEKSLSKTTQPIKLKSGT